ncbi:MAG: adenylate/guanylate cyclase domain-containing protein [Verrucomicrobiota bacterium]
MKRYTLLTTIAVVATGLLSFWLTQRDWLVYSLWWQNAEGVLIDQRYRQRGTKPADTNIVLVGVETSSLTLDATPPDEIGASPTLLLMRKPYPWDRRVYAATLEKLIGAGAKVIVFDFLFPNPSTKEGDEGFAHALAKHRDRVVVGSTFGQDWEYSPPCQDLVPEGMEGSVGFATVWPDHDGIVRRGRYKTSRERESPELRKFASAYPDNLLHLTAQALRKFSDKIVVPPYDRDNFINFQGPSGTYRSIPIETLFVDRLWNNPPLNGATQFVGKIVMVGPMANYFQDIHMTPMGQMSGPELQAQMLATLLNRSWLAESSPAFNQILTLVMVLSALAICFLVRNALLKPLLLFATAAIFFAVCELAFSQGGLVLAMMPPLFGFAMTGSIGLVLQFFLEQIERRRYRNVLDRYVSKNVAETILADTRSFEESLSGLKKSVAVLFSDIRGFTGMTEGRAPEQLVGQLNEYFEEMAGVVLREKGTLQKFIGDAIMAAWGDTHSAGEHEDARLAVRTALQMRTGLAKLNALWDKQPDRSQLQIGIGVNYGEAIVGNIGSPARMEFTVLGDVVNLAARLESATKQFHGDILVGETVEALTRRHFVFRKVGLLTVKGRAKPVEAFDVLAESPAPEPLWLGRYHQAIELFRAREFARAGALFQEVLVEIGGKDFLCEMYISSCERYLAAPPPENWIGNFVLPDK